MTLELWLLASDANPKDEAAPLFPALNGDWCAALQPVMILLGSVYRFYLNSMNMPRGTSWYWYALGAVCSLGAATIIGITAAALRDPVGALLSTTGCGQYRQKFAEQDIVSKADFDMLRMEDLLEVGLEQREADALAAALGI